MLSACVELERLRLQYVSQQEPVHSESLVMPIADVQKLLLLHLRHFQEHIHFQN